MTPRAKSGICHLVAAQAFHEAKIKEFEACCYLGCDQGIKRAEDNALTAMTMLLDAKRYMIALSIRESEGR